MLVSSIDSLITPLTMRIRASTQYMHERTSPCAFVLRFGKFFRKRPLPDLDRELQILARTLFTILVLAPYKELFVNLGVLISSCDDDSILLHAALLHSLLSSRLHIWGPTRYPNLAYPQ